MKSVVSGPGHQEEEFILFSKENYAFTRFIYFIFFKYNHNQVEVTDPIMIYIHIL